MKMDQIIALDAQWNSESIAASPIETPPPPASMDSQANAALNEVLITMEVLDGILDHATSDFDYDGEWPVSPNDVTLFQQHIRDQAKRLLRPAFSKCPEMHQQLVVVQQHLVDVALRDFNEFVGTETNDPRAER